MIILFLAMLGILQATPQDTFAARCDVQGLYDEIAQATLASRTANDIDMFHEVFYAPSWVFVDAQGRRHPWAEQRERAIQALNEPAPDQLRQVLREITLTPEGARVLIGFTTVRTITDTAGKYGRPGATHTVADTTTYRDTLSKSGVTWKLIQREQIGETTTLVDKLPPELENPRCPTASDDAHR